MINPFMIDQRHLRAAIVIVALVAIAAGGRTSIAPRGESGSAGYTAQSDPVSAQA
jgi:hypothetical protein